MVFDAHDVRPVLKHVHHLFVGGDDIVAEKNFPTRQLRQRGHADHAEAIVALGERQPGDRGGMVVAGIRRHGIGASIGAVEIKMQGVGGARGELRVRQLDPVVRHGDDASRAARDRPRFAQVEVNTQGRAVGVAMLEIPLMEEIRVVWPGCVRTALSNLWTPLDRTTDPRLGLLRQPLRFPERRERIRGLENKNIPCDRAREFERTAIQQRVDIGSRFQLQRYPASEFDRRTRIIFRPGLHPGGSRAGGCEGRGRRLHPVGCQARFSKMEARSRGGRLGNHGRGGQTATSDENPDPKTIH